MNGHWTWKAMKAARCAAGGHKLVLYINESGKGWVKTCECGHKSKKVKRKGK